TALCPDRAHPPRQSPGPDHHARGAPRPLRASVRHQGTRRAVAAPRRGDLAETFRGRGATPAGRASQATGGRRMPTHRSETAGRESRTAARRTPIAVHHRTAHVDGLDVFYREAGDADAPALLLLHGFPTSSHMFRHLIPRLAPSFHLVAPDYPGFGLSS